MASQEYKIRTDQSIFDVVNLTIGDLNYTYSLLLANPAIENIDTIPVGAVVVYEPKPVTPATVKSLQYTPTVLVEEFRSRNNQSTFDVALQTYGTLDRVYQLLVDSKKINLLSPPIPGFIFKFNPTLVKDNRFANYLKRDSIILNTLASVNGEWILRTGMWMDTGIWIDTEYWID